VLSLDSYYHDQANLSLAERAGLNYDHPDALDWSLLESNLSALTRGEPIEEPQYVFAGHTRSRETRRVEPAPFLILEGILALHRAEIRRLLDLKVFVVAQAEECLRRRLDRDVAERGRTAESVADQYSRTVWPMAVEFVLPSREFADLSVSGTQPVEQSVEAVLSALRGHRSAHA
jgi:uridine kinase